jgi:hypothetical protein
VIQRDYLRPRSIEPPAKDSPLLERVAWHVGLLSLGLEQAAARHPDWVVVDHEELCDNPTERFRALFAATGLDWTAAAERKLGRLNTAGTGTRTERIARDRIDSWKRSLDESQVRDVTRILVPFEAITAKSVSP